MFPKTRLNLPLSRRDAFLVKVLSTAYLLATLTDILTTIWITDIAKRGVELNPCTKTLLETYGPLAWLLRDTAIYILLLGLVAASQHTVNTLAKHSPKIFQKYFSLLRHAWKLLLAEAAILRALPAIHNLLVLLKV